MKIKLWGVRGSIPSPGPTTVKYGGNTPCIQAINEEEPGEIIILEAGTGIRELGLSLIKLKPKPRIHILLSHTHWDHIHGLPFFIPIFAAGFDIKIYGPVHYDKKLSEILAGQMDYAYFPVRTAELSSDISYRDLKEERLSVGGLEFQTQYMNHPVMTLGYRITQGGKTFVYTGDNEPYSNFQKEGEILDDENIDEFVEEQNNRVVEFARDCSLLVADSQYTDDEYSAKKGWGHSSIGHAVALATKANVKRLVLFHHEPERTDGQLEGMLASAGQKKEELKNSSLEIFLAREKDEYEI
ncbi:MAG: MBL fold metallo-hydrolase [Nitrospinae bacterium]|nr:MBL fold metallo-hydrolase [Nitrospinota bacterium]